MLREILSFLILAAPLLCSGRITFPLSVNNGSSKCPSTCPSAYKPICGSNGITYDNVCVLDLVSCRGNPIYKLYDGECNSQRTRKCTQICAAIYQPVCGSNGITYDNDCELEKADCQNPRIIKVADGECEGEGEEESGEEYCPESCEKKYEPVCGSNGYTYTNDCELARLICEGAPTRKVADGECEETEVQRCLWICPEKYVPVCGSDGNTYVNECELNHSICEVPTIRKIHDGACVEISTKKPRCPRKCPKRYKPVCGSDGITYDNDCQLYTASCKDPTISKIGNGGCEVPFVTSIPLESPPTSSPN